MLGMEKVRQDRGSCSSGLGRGDRHGENAGATVVAVAVLVVVTEEEEENERMLNCPRRALPPSPSSLI